MQHFSKNAASKMLVLVLALAIFARLMPMGTVAPAVALADGSVASVEDRADAFLDGDGDNGLPARWRDSDHAENAHAATDKARQARDTAQAHRVQGDGEEDVYDAARQYMQSADAWYECFESLQELAAHLEDLADDLKRRGLDDEASAAEEIAKAARDEAANSLQEYGKVRERSAERMADGSTSNRNAQRAKDIREKAAEIYAPAADTAYAWGHYDDAARYWESAAAEWDEIAAEREREDDANGAQEAHDAANASLEQAVSHDTDTSDRTDGSNRTSWTNGAKNVRRSGRSEEFMHEAMRVLSDLIQRYEADAAEARENGDETRAEAADEKAAAAQREHDRLDHVIEKSHRRGSDDDASDAQAAADARRRAAQYWERAGDAECDGVDPDDAYAHVTACLKARAYYEKARAQFAAIGDDQLSDDDREVLDRLNEKIENPCPPPASDDSDDGGARNGSERGDGVESSDAADPSTDE